MTHHTPPTSRRVIDAVANEKDVDPIELEPLYETVDPECLDGLFRDDSSIAGRDSNQVRFRYSECLVTVTADESVTVSETTDRPDSTIADGTSKSPESPD